MPDPMVPDVSAGDRFVVTVVCTANVCRSPAMTMLLSEGLARTASRDRVLVRDAGTRVRAGEPGCAEIADRAGWDPAPMRAHRARPLTKELLGVSDLILTVSASERSAVAQLDPEARARTFTVLEAIRLDALSSELGLVPAGRRVTAESRIFRLPGRLHAGRSHTPASGRSVDDDIPDAHTSRAKHVDVARQVGEAAAELTRLIARAAVRP
ncbi:hypothetical protein GL325_14695 [Aeromicrobium sp. 636]|uniref:Phosphotyrosine protein phosphatase I domain-containing protein n=1 Tax=Aeromicrobium senzhongii TaxID=2663859 RepID=A0A8I0K362_9ACTN|nr:MULTISPECIES: hypothetical protein [Aeromicrobium]MBC9227574.1 hypothetical protein [Aeromicrobium senzhongii]MCQ3999671.1 hypothetical protein [Aeromicrobium sp. 636]